MQYKNIVPGIFLARPNRFIAHIEIGGQVEVCHVKNTGRCRELLPIGAKVWCERSANPARKTRFDLIAVQKGSRLINMDSQAPTPRQRNGWRAAGWVRSPICARSAATEIPGLILPLRRIHAPAFWKSRA